MNFETHIQKDLRKFKCYGCSYSSVIGNTLHCTSQYHWFSSVQLTDEQVKWYNLGVFKKYREFTPNPSKVRSQVNTRQLDLVYCDIINWYESNNYSLKRRIEELMNQIEDTNKTIEDYKKENEELEKKIKEKDNIISAYSTVLKEEIK